METRKKYVIGILAIAVVGLLASGSLYAYFNDLESTTGNGVKAATLDLTVNGENPWTNASFVIGTDSKVYPGFSGTKTINLANIGNMDGTLTMTVTHITGAPGITTEPESALGVDAGELEEDLDVVVNNGTTNIFTGKLSALTATQALGTLAAGDTMTLTITYSVATSVGNVIQDDSVTFDIEFVLEQVH